MYSFCSFPYILHSVHPDHLLSVGTRYRWHLSGEHERPTGTRVDGETGDRCGPVGVVGDRPTGRTSRWEVWDIRNVGTVEE